MLSSSPICPICHSESRYDFSGRDLMFRRFDRYDYQKCTSCDFIFQFPLPSPEQISAFYPDSYDVYEVDSRLKKISQFNKSILKRYYGYVHLKTSPFTDVLCLITKRPNSDYSIPFVTNGCLLDVGCGNGRFLDGMKQLGWQVKGVEFNEHAVSVCKLSGLDVHHGDLLSASFEANSFDVINVSHVIEHVPNPVQLFAELERVLKPGGTLIIKTPNSQALGRAWFSNNWFPNEVPRHIYLFSEKNLRALGNACGLQLKQIRTRTSVKIILNSVDYVTGNKGTPSKKIKWKRILARPYSHIAQFKKQGDEIFSLFTKS